MIKTKKVKPDLEFWCSYFVDVWVWRIEDGCQNHKMKIDNKIKSITNWDFLIVQDINKTPTVFQQVTVATAQVSTKCKVSGACSRTWKYWRYQCRHLFFFFCQLPFYRTRCKLCLNRTQVRMIENIQKCNSMWNLYPQTFPENI